MKQVLFTLLAFATLSVSAQNKNNWTNTQGNGVIKTESRTIEPFTAIDNKGSNLVEITFGESTTITVEADENILPIITTTVKDGQLTIGSNGSYSSKHRIKISVSMSRITGLDLHGSGNIIGNGAFSNQGTTMLDLHGSGNIKLGFASFNNLEAAIHGSGNIELTSGKVDHLDASSNGSGNLVAYAVISNDVKAKTSGSGNIKVMAEKSLVAETNGSGNVYYKGNLSNISSKKNGSGTIVKQ